MSRGWWILSSVALSACLPGTSTRDAGAISLCTSKAPCPFFSCTCDGTATYRASRCTTTCSDEVTTCASICPGGVPAGDGGQVWGVTLAVGLEQFFGANGSDRHARDAAVGQCQSASIPLGECTGGNSTLELEPRKTVECVGNFTSGSLTVTYDAVSPTGRTDARAQVVAQCIDAKEVPGPTCGLGQFSCN